MSNDGEIIAACYNADFPDSTESYIALYFTNQMVTWIYHGSKKANCILCRSLGLIKTLVDSRSGNDAD